MQAFLFFWGDAWQQQQDLMEQLSAFFDYIVASPLIDQLGEYSTSGLTIGHGQVAGTTVVADSPPASTVDDSDIQAFLQNQISSNA